MYISQPAVRFPAYPIDPSFPTVLFLFDNSALQYKMAPAIEIHSEKLNLKIIEYIQDLGSCWRCAIRFTRERKPEAYRRKIVVIILVLTDQIALFF